MHRDGWAGLEKRRRRALGYCKGRNRFTVCMALLCCWGRGNLEWTVGDTKTSHLFLNVYTRAKLHYRFNAKSCSFYNFRTVFLPWTLQNLEHSINHRTCNTKGYLFTFKAVVCYIHFLSLRRPLHSQPCNADCHPVDICTLWSWRRDRVDMSSAA